MRNVHAAASEAQQAESIPLLTLLQAKEDQHLSFVRQLETLRSEASERMGRGDNSMAWCNMLSTFEELYVRCGVAPSSAKMMAKSALSLQSRHLKNAIVRHLQILSNAAAAGVTCCKHCGYPASTPGHADLHMRACPVKLLADAKNHTLSVWELALVLLLKLHQPSLYGPHLLIAAAYFDKNSPLHDLVTTILDEVASLYGSRIDGLEDVVRLVKFYNCKGADGLITIQQQLDIGKHFTSVRSRIPSHRMSSILCPRSSRASRLRAKPLRLPL